MKSHPDTVLAALISATLTALTLIPATSALAAGSGSFEFSGCRLIDDDDTTSERCCTTDITPAFLAHWCAEDRLASDPGFPSRGSCRIAGHEEILGRVWHCAADSNDEFEPAEPAPRPAPPPAPTGPEGFPRITGIYSRSSGSVNSGGALAEARENFGEISSLLWQKSLYSIEERSGGFSGQGVSDLDSLFEDPAVLSGRVVPQISVDAVDPVDWERVRVRTLPDLQQKMCNPSSAEAKAMRSWARYLKSKGTTVVFRPFSEMNNPGNGHHLAYHLISGYPMGRASHLAEMWKCMRKIFRDERADKVKFAFNAGGGVLCRRSGSFTEDQRGNQEWIRALRQIPTEDIDVLGIHPYCNHQSAPRPAAVSTQVSTFIRAVENTPHADKPIFVGEMGITRGYSDVQRARWVCEAFQYQRKYRHRIVGMTYFDALGSGKDWRIASSRDPRTSRALREAISLGASGDPLPESHCDGAYR